MVIVDILSSRTHNEGADVSNAVSTLKMVTVHSLGSFDNYPARPTIICPFRFTFFFDVCLDVKLAWRCVLGHNSVVALHIRCVEGG